MSGGDDTPATQERRGFRPASSAQRAKLSRLYRYIARDTTRIAQCCPRSGPRNNLAWRWEFRGRRPRCRCERPHRENWPALLARLLEGVARPVGRMPARGRRSKRFRSDPWPRAYRMPRQRLRTSTPLLSDAAKNCPDPGGKSLSKVAFATPHCRARLSDVAPVTSDQHRALIGCRERRGFAADVRADPYRKPPARLSGAARAYRMLRQQLRISTALLSDVARELALCRAQILIESRSRDFR